MVPLWLVWFTTWLYSTPVMGENQPVALGLTTREVPVKNGVFPKGMPAWDTLLTFLERARLYSGKSRVATSGSQNTPRSEGQLR